MTSLMIHALAAWPRVLFELIHEENNKVEEQDPLQPREIPEGTPTRRR
jgi:hypothetical protein